MHTLYKCKIMLSLPFASLRYTSTLRQKPLSSPVIFMCVAVTGSNSEWNSVSIPLIRENICVEKRLIIRISEWRMLPL